MSSEPKKQFLKFKNLFGTIYVSNCLNAQGRFEQTDKAMFFDIRVYNHYKNEHLIIQSWVIKSIWSAIILMN